MAIDIMNNGIPFEVCLDITPDHESYTVTVITQGVHKGSYLKFNLFENGTELAIPTGTNYRYFIDGKRPDNGHILRQATEVSGNSLIFKDISHYITDVVGDISLKLGWQNLSTGLINYLAEDIPVKIKKNDLYTSNVTSTDEYSLMMDVLGNADNIISNFNGEATTLITTMTNTNKKLNDTNTAVINAENTRISNETARNTSETTRNTQETTRQSNETTRQSNETTRKTNETSRQSSETTRTSQESTRESNESTRKTNETTRESNESTRKTNETSRQSNETTRNTNETSRQTAENSRATAESSRVSAESTRQTQEQARQTNTAKAITDCETATDRADEVAARYEELEEIITDNSVVSDENITQFNTYSNQYVKSQIDEINRTIVNLNTYVTPQMFGAKGDGTTDDTIALQNAVNYARVNNITLKSYRNNTFAVSAPIILANDNGWIDIDFQSATIKAISQMDHVLYYSGTVTNRLSIISGIKIECNDMANYGYYIKYARSQCIRDTYITNPIKSGIRIVRGNIKLEDAYIANDSFINPESQGIHVESTATDSKINKVYMYNMKYAIVDNGADCQYFQVHAWIIAPSLLNGSIFATTLGNASFIQCYADTYHCGYYLTDYGKINLDTCLFFANPEYYNDTTFPTPPVMFKFKEAYYTKNLTMNSCRAKFAGYNGSTGKNALFSELQSTDYRTSVTNFIGLKNRNIFEFTDNIPSISNGVSAITMSNSTVTSSDNELILQDGMLNINGVYVHSTGYASNYDVTIGVFPNKAYSPRNKSVPYYVTGVLSDSSGGNRITVLVTVNSTDSLLTITVKNDADEVARTRLYLNMSLPCYIYN